MCLYGIEHVLPAQGKVYIEWLCSVYMCASYDVCDSSICGAVYVYDIPHLKNFVLEEMSVRLCT